MYDEEIQDQSQEHIETQEKAAPAPDDSFQSKNFRALKERLDRTERELDRAARERDERERRLQDLEARFKQPEPKYADDDDGNDDDLVDKKTLKKRMQRELDRERKVFAEELKKQHQQLESKLSEDRLRMMYPDIDHVLSPDNIESLKSVEPDLARTISASTDNYGKAVSAYKLIKKLGIYQDPAEADKIQKNLSKPRPASSVGAHQGDTPLTKAHEYGERLSSERKSQLWREMQDSIR